MDKESFKKQLISAEQPIADRVKQFRLTGEKEKEGREVKLKGKKSPLK